MTKSLRIGIVCHPTFGGSGVLATELANYLGGKGHQVHILSYAQPVRFNTLHPNLHFHEVQVESYPLFLYQPYELALSSAMVEMVIQEDLDLLHVHYAIPHAYAAYMARKILQDRGRDLPVVTTLHGTDITLVGKHPAYRPAVCFSIDHSTVVTAVSESLKADTLEHFNSQKDIRVVPNFIQIADHHRKAPSARSRLVKDGEYMICHVSNFRKVKRVKDVIKVFAKVANELPVQLVMVGDGPERVKCEALAAKLGVANRVNFLGKSTAVTSILNQAHVFLLPSETESFGLAALEAMASHVPVVASRAGGLPEVIKNGVTGYLEEVGDIKAMAQRVKDILKDEATHAQFASAARAHAEAFDVEHIAHQYESIYQEVLNG